MRFAAPALSRATVLLEPRRNPPGRRPGLERSSACPANNVLGLAAQISSVPKQGTISSRGPRHAPKGSSHSRRRGVSQRVHAPPSAENFPTTPLEGFDRAGPRLWKRVRHAGGAPLLLDARINFQTHPPPPPHPPPSRRVQVLDGIPRCGRPSQPAPPPNLHEDRIQIARRSGARIPHPPRWFPCPGMTSGSSKVCTNTTASALHCGHKPQRPLLDCAVP